MVNKANTSKSTLIFSWIGKITAVLTLLYLLMQISGFLSRTNYSLSVKGDLQNLYFPVTIEKIMGHHLDQELDLEAIKNIKAIIILTIKNDGDTQINGLELLTSFDEAFYGIKKMGREVENGRFKEKLNLGDLKPANEMKVIILRRSWFNYIIGNTISERGNIIIAHSKGKVKVQFPEKVYGFLASLDKRIEYVGTIPFIILGILLVGILLLILIAVLELAGYEIKKKVK